MQALRLVSTKELPHDEWLEWRRKGIGGSDVAPICGLSRYSSPLAVYMDKIGELPPKEDNLRMKAGRMLEPLIADWFAEETGIKVQRQNWIFQHKDHPFMLANIDRWIPGQNAGLEIKNTGEYSRHDWFEGDTETIPTEYMLQANHYMAVTGADRWYVAVLIGGWDFQWRVIERDDGLIKNLIAIEREFWEGNVLAKIPPIATSQDTDLLSHMYPESKPTKYDIPEVYYDRVKRLCEAHRTLETAKSEYEDAKNKIKELMGDNEVAFWQGERFATWKTDKRGTRSFRKLGGI